MGSTLKGLFGGGEDDDDGDVKRAKDFVSRYEQGDPTEGYSTEEAAEGFRRVAKTASSDELRRAARQSVDRLNPEQRSQFADLLNQRRSEQGARVSDDPDDLAGMITRVSKGEGESGTGLDDLLGGLLGGGSGGITDLLGGLLGGGEAKQGQAGATAGLGDLMGSPIVKAVLGGIAAYAMKEIVDK